MPHLPSPNEFKKLQDVFISIKSEDETQTDWWETVFVKTAVYNALQPLGRCILVGRKGSGKTALLGGHSMLHRGEYLAEGNILADNFPFQPLYDFYYRGLRNTVYKITEGESGDLPSLIEPIKLSHYAWRKTLLCYSVLLLGAQIEKLSDCKLDEKKAVLKYCEKMSKIAGLDEDATAPSLEGILVFFFRQIQDVVESVLEKELPDFTYLLSVLSTRLSHFIDVRTRTELEEVAELMRVMLARNNAPILLTLDKFDDYFDHFGRTYTPARTSEMMFMSDLLEGLLLAVRDLRRSKLFNNVHMLFTLPADRFYDLPMRERAQLEEHVSDIN